MPSAQAPHNSSRVLILIDGINHFEFPDGERVLRQALPVAPRLVRLKERARAAGMSTIYVNENFGHASTLVLAGLATNSCIVCTARDTKMRAFGLYVPADFAAARTAKERGRAIEHIPTMTGANVSLSRALRLREIFRKSHERCHGS